MSLSWKFKRRPNLANPKEPGKLRPFATVALVNEHGERTLWDEFALVDSGAENTIFPRSCLTEEMKSRLNFTSSHDDITTVVWKGTRLQIWHFELTVELTQSLGNPQRIICGIGRIGFWKDLDEDGHQNVSPAPYALLGIGGVLEHLEFKLFAGQKRFELSPDADLPNEWQEKSR
jgi:hypothetical protein